MLISNGFFLSPVLRKLGSPPNKMLARENKTNRKSLNKELEKNEGDYKTTINFPSNRTIFFNSSCWIFFFEKFHYYQLTFDKVINQSQQSQCPQIH